MRFEALAGHARLLPAAAPGEEVGWYEHADGLATAALLRAPEPGAYSGLVFARDRRQRFCAVGETPAKPTRPAAEAALRRAMQRALKASPQPPSELAGPGGPLDFFAIGCPRPQRHPDFLRLAELEAYSPARGMIEAMLRQREHADDAIVAEFQTKGFERRLWELQLDAALTELGYRLRRGRDLFNFLCSGPLGAFALKTLIVGSAPTAGAAVAPPRCDTPEALLAFLRHYMPIRFANTLLARLQRAGRRRAKPAAGPLVYALADCTASVTLTGTRAALDLYLYGRDQDWRQDEQGRPQVSLRKAETHCWENKVLRSGFFELPGADSISAVLFSNGGALDKCNRMGVLAGFGSGRVLLTREGLQVDHEPGAAGPKPFRRIVNEPDYTEAWNEGLDVFHNPRALVPLPEHCLPGCAHHWLVDGVRRVSRTPA